MMLPLGDKESSRRGVIMFWSCLACWPGGSFTNISRALQDFLLKFVYCRNCSSYKNFKLKLCMCAQSHALGAHTKFQLEIRTINVISSVVYFREIILESSRKVSETTPSCPFCCPLLGSWVIFSRSSLYVWLARELSIHLLPSLLGIVFFKLLWTYLWSYIFLALIRWNILLVLIYFQKYSYEYHSFINLLLYENN